MRHSQPCPECLKLGVDRTWRGGGRIVCFPHGCYVTFQMAEVVLVLSLDPVATLKGAVEALSLRHFYPPDKRAVASQS